MSDCHYCGPTDREMRPYGPGGSTVCLPCVKSAPERELAAMRVYQTLLEAAEAMSETGAVSVGSEAGPQPVSYEDLLPPAE